MFTVFCHMILHDGDVVHLHSVTQLPKRSSCHRSGDIKPLLTTLLQSAFWATNTAVQYLLMKWTDLYPVVQEKYIRD